MKTFPKPVYDVGTAFIQAHAKRHMADCDPTYRVALAEVIDDIDTAEGAIRDLVNSGRKDRRALAARVLPGQL